MTDDRTITKPPQDEAGARPRGVHSKFGWAGFGLIALAATVAFLVTAVSWDVIDDFPDWRFSGGLVSMVGGIYLGRKCGSWPEFWARVWIWMAAAALLAGLGVWGVSAQSDARSSDQAKSQSPPTDDVTALDPDASRVQSREGTDVLFKAGFGTLYRLQYKREASKEVRREAYEYALIACEALDRGMSPRQIYKRMAESKGTKAEFMFFHMSFMSAVEHVCDEYEPAYERFIQSAG